MRVALYLTSLLLTPGCVSYQKILDQGDYQTACDERGGNEEALFEHLSTRSDLSVYMHVFTPEELARFMPMVPTHLLSGDMLLVALRYDVGDKMIADGLSMSQRLEHPRYGIGGWAPYRHHREVWSEGLGIDMVGPEEEDEPTSAGLVRALGVVGGFALGTMSDLIWASTLGFFDPDTSGLEGSVLSPRSITNLVIDANRREGTEEIEPEEEVDPAMLEEQRRIATVAILDEIIEQDYCRIEEPGGSCTIYGFERRDDDHQVVDARLMLSIHRRFERMDEEEDCIATENLVIDLPESGDLTSVIRSLFPLGEPIPQAELPALHTTCTNPIFEDCHTW